MRRNHRNKNKINLKDKQIKKILELIAFLLIIIIFICLIKILANSTKKSNNVIETSSTTETSQNLILEDNQISNETNSSDANEEEKPINFNLTAIGDTLCHNTQYWDAYNSETKEYDFSYVYEDIKYYTKVADITIGSLETTFAGADRGYSNYPTFNSPDSLATSLKKIGVDVISLAGNHALDYGYSGLCRTIDVLDKIDALDEISRKLLNRTLYANVISSMEAYLSDRLIQKVLSSEDNKRLFVENFKDFNDSKISISDIFKQMENLDSYIKKTLRDIIYHNLPRVKNIYKTTLSVDLGDVSELMKCISIRHDIVHRNGKDKNGNLRDISKDDVSILAQKVSDFIQNIENQFLMQSIDDSEIDSLFNL